MSQMQARLVTPRNLLATPKLKGKVLDIKAALRDKVETWIDFIFNDSPSVGMFYCISQDLYVNLADYYKLSAEDTYTQTGVVLNPIQAAQCLTELQRTTAFTRGLHAAVEQKLSEGSRPVRIFYAGCGPFATLILPLTYKYQPDQVQVTLLDLHQEAADAAVDLLGVLGKSDFIVEAIVEDAVTFRFPENSKYDIVVTETLQRALTRECHVPIVQNLMTQLPQDVLLVPEEIRVKGLWTVVPEGHDYRAAERPDDVDLGTILSLNADTARSGELVRSVEGKAPARSDQTFCLQTEIDVFGPWKLRRNECGLTCPHPEASFQVASGQPMEFRYELGDYPGLRQILKVQ